MAWDIRTGSWSEPELDLIPLAIRPGELVLDIGANYGFWSYHLSRAVGPTGRVLAFEPVPSTCEVLRFVTKTILRLRNVDILRLGCAEETGTTEFTAPLQESGAISAGLAHLSDRQDEIEENGSPRVATSVGILCDVVSLDEFLPGIRNVSFVKCDIEGAELLAFRGASRLIAENHPTIVCEVTESFLAGFGFSVADLTTFLCSLGYQQYHYDQGRTPELWEVTSTEDITWHNYAFIHPDRIDRFRAMLT